jgi:lipid-A-disaccharide synthase
MPTTIFVSTHETSGDGATAELMLALRRELAPDPVRAVGLGGPKLRDAGVELWRETTEHAAMGLVEVVKSIPHVLGDIVRTAERVARLDPDVAILVDAPDYNIRLAKALRKRAARCRIVYFLSPQIWAWRSGRVKQLRKFFDRRLCIVPFEPGWYAQHYTQADFIGHPSVSRIARWREALERESTLARAADARQFLRRRWSVDPGMPVAAILPGSRRGEIRRVLETQLLALAAVNKRRIRDDEPGLTPIVSVAPARDPRSFVPIIERVFAQPNAREMLRGLTLIHPDGKLVERINAETDGEMITGAMLGRGTSWGACLAAEAALVCSGTATVETALLGAPQVVCYRANPISAEIIRRLVRVRYASLVNLVCGREVIPECLQDDCTVERLADELRRLLMPGPRAQMLVGYADFRELIGPPGAERRAAAIIAHDLREAAAPSQSPKQATGA